MRKILGLVLALLVTLTLSASAEEVKGTVTAIDRADRSIVLDDGTKLTVSESQLTNVAPGAQVRAMYESDGSKDVVSRLDLRGIGSESRGTTNWGTPDGTDIDSYQSGE